MSRLSRRVFAPVLAVVAALGLFTAQLVVTSAVATPSAVAAPAAPPAGYGFTGGSAMLDTPIGALNRELDAVRQTRARWLRVLVDRSQVEVSPGRYDWSKPDRVINAARAHGLTVLANVAFTPFNQGGGLMRTAPPARLGDFAAFAARAAERYRGRVSNWEIWNEPNLNAFFGGIPNKPQVYATMLRLTYPAIKRAQPNSTVIAGGLSRQLGVDSPPAFMQAVYRFGGRGFFDAAAMHPYIFPGGDPDNAYSDIARVHGVMTANGDGRKKIWFTEVGAPSNAPGPEGVTPQQQANLIAVSLNSLSRLPYAGPVFIYSVRDTANDPVSLVNRETRFGALLTSDFRLKPGYFLLKR